MTISEITKNLDFNLFKQRLSKLDPILNDLISGGSGSDLIVDTAVKYDFDTSYSSTLILLLSLYLTKIFDSQKLIDYLATLIPEKYFPQFLQELEDKLWSPYDVYLNKAGVVYKQLTKLTPAPIQQATDNLQQTSDNQPTQLIQEQAQPVKPAGQLENNQQPIVQPVAPVISLKEVVISDLAEPRTGNQPINPLIPVKESVIESGARVKFDMPKTGPEIQKSISFEINPSLPEVKFKEPEIKPEVGQNVSASTPGTQNQPEKKIEIPKAQEIKKTDVSGRQVIDLTSFGLSKPDEK